MHKATKKKTAKKPKMKKVSKPAKKAKLEKKKKTKIPRLSKEVTKKVAKPKASQAAKKPKIKVVRFPKPHEKAGKKVIRLERISPVSVSHAMPRAGENIAAGNQAGGQTPQRTAKKLEPQVSRGTGELREIRLEEKDGMIKVGLYSEFGLLREDLIEKNWIGEEVKLILSSAVRTMRPGDEVLLNGLGPEDLKMIMDAHIELATDSEIFVEEYEEKGKMGLRIFVGPTERELVR